MTPHDEHVLKDPEEPTLPEDKDEREDTTDYQE